MRGKTVAMIAVLAVLIGGGAIAATLLTASDETPDTQALIPENAFLYLDGSRELSDRQREACDDLAGRFPDLDDCTALGNVVREAMDEQLVKEDMSFEDDIETWLGNDFAMFMTTDNLGELIRQSQQPSDFDLASFEDGDQLGSAQDPGESRVLPVAAMLVAVDDEDAARAFLAEGLEEEPALEARNYEGIDYHYSADGAWGVFEGHLVFGTEVGLKAVVDQRNADSSLEDNERFTDAVDAARGDRLGLAYVDVKPAFEAALDQLPPQFPQGFFRPFLDATERPVTVTAHLEEGAMSIEAASSATGLRGEAGSGDAGGAALRSLPSAAWGAIGLDGVAETVDGLLEMMGTGVPGGREALEGQFRRETGLDLQRDVLSWMGASGLFIGGERDSDLFGGLTIETSDPKATARTILTLERLLARDNPTEIITRAGFRGFIARIPGQEQVGIMAVDDERAVVALASLSLLDELADGQELGDSEGFAAAQESLGEDFEVNGYFDVDMVREVIERSVPGDDVYEEEIRPYLEPMEHIVFGTRVEGEIARDRFVVGVE